VIKSAQKPKQLGCIKTTLCN